MKRKLMLFLTFILVGVGLASAQSKVTGTVVSAEDGEPVIGASVFVQGTRTGVTTDLNGRFVLDNLPKDSKRLVVSYVGMESRTVDIKPNMKIVLESDGRNIDEVVVVAFGTATKESFTGSATTIKADDIAKVQTSNALEALDGKVAGVQMRNASGQPGDVSPTIRIRGISSINAGNAPLIVVDGAPYDGDLNSINTADIESMTVLKDAASNALYGARGANGVIMITTKKAKFGTANVSFDAKWGSNSRASQRYKTINDPGQYYETYYKALKNFISDTYGYSDEVAHTLANRNLTANNSFGLGYNVYSLPEGESLIGTDGKLNPNATMGNVVNGYLLQADDWYKAVYQNSLRQEYNVQVDAATDKSNFLASVGYLNNEGIVANSGFERITSRLKADYQVKPFLKVGANMSFAHSNLQYTNSSDDGSSSSSGNVFAVATQLAPIYPLYMRDANGNILVDENGNTRYDYGDGENAGLTRPTFGQNNPYSDIFLNADRSDANSFNTNFFAEVRFLKDFKFTTTNTIYFDDSRYTSSTNPYYGQYASQNGIVYKSHSRNYSVNLQQLLDWKHSYGKNNVSAMIGHEAYNTTYYFLSGSKSNMFDPTNLELAGSVTAGSQNSYTTKYNTEGYFGRAMYDYDERYFASASYRRDASSRFAPENRWGNFWSLGGAWIINKESWFPKNSAVDMLKYKISYGQQGNDAIGNYRYTNGYTIENASGHAAVVSQSYMGNRDITWETQNNFNTGFDFEFWNGRLSGSIEYFYRKTTDMLFSFPLPTSYGYSSYYDNVGDMRNSGIEVDLSGDVIRKKNFTWSLNANLTHYRNKITYLANENKTTTVEGYDGYASSIYFYGEGLPLYTYYIPKYAGVDKETGKSLWYMDTYEEDADGNSVVTGRTTTDSYSDATDYLCGTALPDLYGGFGTSFRYKGFDLSVDFVFQLGGKVYDYDYASLMACPTTTSGRGSAIHVDMLKAWTTDNTDSNIPRWQLNDSYAAAQSDRFLTSGSYLSLQNVNFGYTLPAHIAKSLKLQKFRVYVTGDNLWLWSKRQGLDPRQSFSGAGSTGSYYSSIRTISGGVSLTF
jgi:TonB-linked SusC/RagA family outer membrane protein